MSKGSGNRANTALRWVGSTRSVPYGVFLIKREEKNKVNQEMLTHLVQTHYGKAIRTFQRIQSFSDPDDQEIYQLDRLQLDDESAWILQAYHDTYTSRWIFSWTGFASLTAWLRQRTMILTYLAKQNYPAPRLALTCNSTSLCQSSPWHMMLTSCIAGETEEYTSQALSLMGKTLGTLHQLPLPSDIGPSWWGSTTIAYALAEMRTVAAEIPPAHQDLHATFVRTLQIMHDAHLPQTLIHGDCWPLNAIRSGSQLTLIDWEFAGRGAALLDLAGLLLMGQCDQNGDLPEKADAARVTAIVQGYAQRRLLSSEEWHFLCEALRFVIVWRGAMLFARVKNVEWDPKWERLLARTLRGYRLADQIASIAAQAFPENAAGPAR